MKFYFNEHKLELGELKADDFSGSFKMTNDSSYLEKFLKRYSSSKSYRSKLLPLKLQCLLNIKASIKDDYSSYSDPLAGIGMSVKIFATSSINYLNDFCKDCFGILKLNFSGESYRLSNSDIFKSEPEKVDFTFVDLNNCTLKRFVGEYKNFLSKVFQNSKKYVLLNDCSIFYLKYGKLAYDNYSKIIGDNLAGNKKDFYEKTKKFYKKLYPEWSLVEVQSFSDTSFLLFKRGDFEELKIQENKVNSLMVSTNLC